jgi:hypothetical protein
MADVKISGLPASTTPLAGTEVLPVVQGGATKQVSIANVTAGRAVSGLNFNPTGATIPTNGVYLPAANNLALATNSTERARIDSGGNVAIGASATSDSAKVYVSAATGSSDFVNNSALFISTSNENSTAALIRFNGAVAKGLVFGRGINADSFIWGFTNTTTPVMTLFGSGGLSIGNTTDPGATNLSVTGTGKFNTTLSNGSILNINSGDTVPATSGTTQNGGLRVASKNTGTGGYVLDTGVSDTNGYAWLQMSNSANLNGAYAREIALNPLGGNVLIGTTTNRSGVNSLVMGGLIFPQQATTAAAPTYVKGAIYFDTTLNKLRVGGATGWETITSV